MKFALDVLRRFNAVPKRLFGMSDRLDHRLELRRLNGVGMIGAGKPVAEREMLLDDIRAEGRRTRRADERIARMVGDARWDFEYFSHRDERAKI
jgi:hypothetical protein